MTSLEWLKVPASLWIPWIRCVSISPSAIANYGGEGSMGGQARARAHGAMTSFVRCTCENALPLSQCDLTSVAFINDVNTGSNNEIQRCCMGVQCTGNLYKAFPWLRECCRQGESEVIRNSRNKIHQTWKRPYRDSLYNYLISFSKSQVNDPKLALKGIIFTLKS